MNPSPFHDRAREDGWEPDYSLPVLAHAFYEQTSYWRKGDEVMDEYELRHLLGFEETAR